MLHLQLALFFEDIENRPDKFIPKITEISDNVFDQMPTILPIPLSAPPEIPVVILSSGDGKYTCNIAKSRIDFINTASSSSEGISSQLENFVNKIRPYVSVIYGYKKIVRFGLICQYLFKTEDPVKNIQSKYLKTNLGSLEELTIRYNKKIEVSGLLINDIVEVGKGTIPQDGSGETGVIILRDINNALNTSELPIEDLFLVIKSQLSNLGAKGIMEILR